MRRFATAVTLGMAVIVWLFPAAGRAQSSISFQRRTGSLQIWIRDKHVGDYVWVDPHVRRPFFARLHALNGVQVTRNHPPADGQDATDHATMHPGLWLAFGDLAGLDFWRNDAAVEHVEFLDAPAAENDEGGFRVRNRYLANGKLVCEETCRITLHAGAEAWTIDWTSEFTGPDSFSFGDQEEMGLGVRLASPLTVKNGGRITNSHQHVNEAQVWGKQADWCDYSGLTDGRRAGITLMPAPDNFRQCWFHARDYGLLVANPFGVNAFTRQSKSEIRVPRGETFRLRFGILIHAGDTDLPAAFRNWQTLSRCSH